MQMRWFDIYKLWKMATDEPDPIARRERMKPIEGAGVTSPESIPDLRNDGGYLSGNRNTVIQLRDSKDMIDLSSVSNRQSRYKEYERLRTIAEIETALTVFADESCVTGDTLVSTPFGYFRIDQLAQEKDPEEEFLVYCYDFSKKDYSLGWAYHPRLVKSAPTVRIALDNGTSFSCTHDHRVLLKTGEWIEAGKLKEKDELMPFYRIHGGITSKGFKIKEENFHNLRRNQFARIFTFTDGWKSERQFIDEWRTGKKTERQERISKIMRYIQGGLNTDQICKLVKLTWATVNDFLISHGFTYTEVQTLNNRFPDRRRVLHVTDGGVQKVYDLSVRGHENFATNTTIFHNCQIGENGHLFDIEVKNKDIRDELDFLFFHPKMLNMDRKLWNIAKNLYLRGDHFVELVLDPEDPKLGILKLQSLPADSMYRIETIKGKLIEFQQSKEGPDYISLSRVEVMKATEADLAQATAIRFAPSQIVHFKIGDDRQTFYPYGVSMLEAARGPAHQLRLLEDAMLVYRLCLVGDTRIRTDNGYKYIKDIRVGDKVWTFEKSGLLAKSNVTNWVNNGVKPVFKVESKHNEIIGTATHPILVHDSKEFVLKYVDIENLIPKRHQLVNVTCDSSVPVTISNRIVDEQFAKSFGLFVKKRDSKLFSYRIPAWVFTSSKQIRKAFIEGLADRIETKSGLFVYKIKSQNKQFIENVKEIWHSIGLSSGKIKQGKYWSISLNEKPLPIFENVLSVKACGEEEVFDISVDNEEHNFVANGIIVHNTRAPERRIFYIDVGQLPPFKAEAFMERMKDTLRKKKTYSARGGTGGASPVEERWTMPSQDEDFFIPLRPNSSTRVETLPGASNLGEVDDALYFRNKLFIALCFPKNYMAQEDIQVTRTTASSMNVQFARLIERLQSSIVDGLTEIAIRHLELRGFPNHLYDDIKIKMTPPSHWRELSENEVIQTRYDRAMALKGSQLFADLDIMTKILKIPIEEAKEIVSRAMIQKVQDLKLQIMASNPQLMGAAMPGQDVGPEEGQDVGPEELAQQPEQPQLMKKMGGGKDALDTYGEPEEQQATPLPDPTTEDLRKYDLEIFDYSKGQDEEEIDELEVD